MRAPSEPERVAGTGAGRARPTRGRARRADRAGVERRGLAERLLRARVERSVGGLPGLLLELEPRAITRERACGPPASRRRRGLGTRSAPAEERGGSGKSRHRRLREPCASRLLLPLRVVEPGSTDRPRTGTSAMQRDVVRRRRRRRAAAACPISAPPTACSAMSMTSSSSRRPFGQPARSPPRTPSRLPGDARRRDRQVEPQLVDEHRSRCCSVRGRR